MFDEMKKKKQKREGPLQKRAQARFEKQNTSKKKWCGAWK